MINLREDEKHLIGTWLPDGNEVVGDEVCQRIMWLISDVLIYVGTDASGWDALYQDPSDNRFWILYYPQSELHGGGPPSLKVVSNTDEIDKYRNNTNS